MAFCDKEQNNTHTLGCPGPCMHVWIKDRQTDRQIDSPPPTYTHMCSLNLTKELHKYVHCITTVLMPILG